MINRPSSDDCFLSLTGSDKNLMGILTTNSKTSSLITHFRFFLNKKDLEKNEIIDKNSLYKQKS